jgi:hypothetical protein
VLKKQCDRCYDFLNIFAKKIGAKIIGVFDSKQSYAKQKNAKF